VHLIGEFWSKHCSSLQLFATLGSLYIISQDLIFSPFLFRSFARFLFRFCCRPIEEAYLFLKGSVYPYQTLGSVSSCATLSSYSVSKKKLYPPTRKQKRSIFCLTNTTKLHVANTSVFIPVPCTIKPHLLDVTTDTCVADQLVVSDRM
jgi:hypothetical protein